MSIASRVVVVTGSSSGIGQCIARAFAQRGDSVVVHGFQNLAGLSHSAKLVAETGADVRAIVADVSNVDSSRQLVNAAFAWQGRVDVWINAAGADVLTGAPSKLSFDEKLERLWKTDVLGTIRISRAVASRMLEQQGLFQNSKTNSNSPYEDKQAPSNISSLAPGFAGERVGVRGPNLQAIPPLTPQPPLPEDGERGRNVLGEETPSNSASSNLTSTSSASFNSASSLASQRQSASNALPTIINLSWDQAEAGFEGDSGQFFSPTKAAIAAFSKSLAKSVGPHVRVNCIAPGWIQTAWGTTASEAWERRAKGESILARWGHPSDIANAAIMLASRECEFINGQTIAVNGGWKPTPT